MAIKVKKSSQSPSQSRNGMYEKNIARNERPAAKVSRRRNEAPVGAARIRLSTDEIQQRVRERAYQLFESRGCAHGFHDQDWIEAELQIRRENGIR